MTHEARLTSENALEIMEGYDLVVDGTDNYPTRYLVNDACVMLGIPNVYGSIFRFDGPGIRVLPRRTGRATAACTPSRPRRASFPAARKAASWACCPGIIGTIQATEAVKLILGKGESLAGRLLVAGCNEDALPRAEAQEGPRLPRLRRRIPPSRH